MLQFIEGPDSAIALAIGGTLADEDLERIIDRLDETMRRSDRIDVFVETRHIDGIQLSALASYTARALPLLGKLKLFRRVAVVADQGWIRAATRLESFLLPSISYRVFRPESREGALQWALYGADVV